MYLSALYQHKKILFCIVVLFMCGQVFVNIKRGLVISPFYHYGMYSSVIIPDKIYLIAEITADGQLLKASDFSAQQWDNILLPAAYFKDLGTQSNPLYNTTIIRILAQLQLHPSQAHYITACNYPKFEQLYKAHLGRILWRKVEKLQIIYRVYQLHNNKLVATNKTQSLQQLCQ